MPPMDLADGTDQLQNELPTTTRVLECEEDTGNHQF
eukprot:COSAG02_NODE_62_length_43372_cov_14.404710_5_plen_36_part_00